jgi:hypothetical protein
MVHLFEKDLLHCFVDGDSTAPGGQWKAAAAIYRPLRLSFYPL